MAGSDALLLCLMAALVGPLAAASAEPSGAMLIRLVADAEARMEAKFEKRMGVKLDKIDSLEAQLAEHAKRLDRLAVKDSAQQTQIDRCAKISSWDTSDTSTVSRRGMQSQGPASGGEVIRMWRREAMSMAPTQYADTGGHHHRRWLQAEACDLSTIKQLSEEINTECCNESSEDCTGGVLHSCNVGCATLIVPLWNSCGAVLGDDAASIGDAVATCPDPTPTSARALAQRVRNCPGSAPSVSLSSHMSSSACGTFSVQIYDTCAYILSP
jgi:hypothetical protein